MSSPSPSPSPPLLPSTLPATQEILRDSLGKDDDNFFLWTKSTFQNPKPPNVKGDSQSNSSKDIQVRQETTSNTQPNLPNRLTEDRQSCHTQSQIHTRNESASPCQNLHQKRPIENTVESDEDDEEEEERAKFRAPLSSFQNRATWRAPTFATKVPATQGIPITRRDQNQDRLNGGDIDKEQMPPPSTFSGVRNWRIPIATQQQEQQQNNNNANDECISQRLSLSVNHDFDIPLTTLEDTDDSEMADECEEEMDEFEMQDYLQYRLRTGLYHLDERLGKECLHAAQDDERLLADQGGLTSGGLIEVSGTPGSGKTTLLMQLAIKERLNSLVQSAEAIHEPGRQGSFEAAMRAAEEEEGEEATENTSVARQVVIIDTEGSISSQRMAQMAKSLINEFLESWQEEEWIARPEHAVLFHHTMTGIHIIRCTSLNELLATFEVLFPAYGNPTRLSDEADDHEKSTKDLFLKRKDFDEMAQSKQLPRNTSLIVIDTISHFFRAPTTNEKHDRLKRRNALTNARTFANRCHSCGIKLIMSTQMSSYFVDSKGERTTMTHESSIGFMRPTLRGWMDEQTVQDAWLIQLFRANLIGQKRIAKVLSRPSSLLNHDLFGDDYWNAELPYLIDNKDGIMRAIHEEMVS